ncbi:hypothetical protein FSZ31_03065 [Sphingorhabdus soli]|uniref:Uncharacterized protein n=1 Tax=Flavisphingopyxis soli TaxID=2601267 RepID=A0A5C6US87_9SPHN|nr:hypothetical protein [Sphingorhabdus soli]TXC73728.1 hypothetical protein FSZ31_03065 [Sphingorhabdus soli]
MTQPTPDSRRRRPRRNGWTNERRKVFLNVLRAWGNVAHAAHVAGMSREGAYRLRRRCPQFARAWDAAMAHDAPPLPVTRRPVTTIEKALVGDPEEVRYHGKRVGYRYRPDGMVGLALLRRLDRLLD